MRCFVLQPINAGHSHAREAQADEWRERGVHEQAEQVRGGPQNPI